MNATYLALGVALAFFAIFVPPLFPYICLGAEVGGSCLGVNIPNPMDFIFQIVLFMLGIALIFMSFRMGGRRRGVSSGGAILLFLVMFAAIFYVGFTSLSTTGGTNVPSFSTLDTILAIEIVQIAIVGYLLLRGRRR